MEGFVRAITGGGIGLVAGLWTLAVFSIGTAPWMGGAVLVAVGSAGVVYGIASEIDPPAP